MSRLMAAIYDPFMRRTEVACLRAWRETLLSDLVGDVVEVGAGTGANLPLYPSTLRSLTLCEPDASMRAILVKTLESQRSSALDRSVKMFDAPAEKLPLASDSVDAVVCTLVLCSVPDPRAALDEMRRVLRPDGKLYFLEHVAAHNNPARLRWQRRVEPVWSLLADGCRVTRDTAKTIREAGFEISDERRESMRQALPWIRPTVRGVAVKRR